MPNEPNSFWNSTSQLSISQEKSKKLDTLTRLAQNKLKSINNLRQFQTLLKDKHLDDNVRKALSVILCTNTVADNKADNPDNDIDKLFDTVDEVEKIEKKKL